MEALSSTQIQFRVRKGSTSTFSRVYKMTFRFYVERLTFSGACSVATRPVSQSGDSCSVSGNSITFAYSSFFNTGNSHNWPTWSAGSEYVFKFNIGSITG
jgi:hypothetical protein